MARRPTEGVAAILFVAGLLSIWLFDLVPKRGVSDEMKAQAVEAQANLEAHLEALREDYPVDSPPPLESFDGTYGLDQDGRLWEYNARVDRWRQVTGGGDD